MSQIRHHSGMNAFATSVLMDFWTWNPFLRIVHTLVLNQGKLTCTAFGFVTVSECLVPLWVLITARPRNSKNWSASRSHREGRPGIGCMDREEVACFSDLQGLPGKCHFPVWWCHNHYFLSERCHFSCWDPGLLRAAPPSPLVPHWWPRGYCNSSSWSV